MQRKQAKGAVAAAEVEEVSEGILGKGCREHVCGQLNTLLNQNMDISIVFFVECEEQDGSTKEVHLLSGSTTRKDTRKSIQGVKRTWTSMLG